MQKKEVLSANGKRHMVNRMKGAKPSATTKTIPYNEIKRKDEESAIEESHLFPNLYTLSFHPLLSASKSPLLSISFPTFPTSLFPNCEDEGLFSTHGTVVENGKKHRQNIHLINHFPPSEGVSEVSKRVNEWARRRAWAKRAMRSKRMCERTSETTSEWPSTLCVYSWIIRPTLPWHKCHETLIQVCHGDEESI